MKRLISIFILSLHLVSSTPLQEVTKITVLFEHYNEHKSLDSKITFFRFVVEHYNNVPHNDNDAERDSKLPFKSMTEGHTHHHVAIDPSKFILAEKPSYLLPKSYNGSYQEQFVQFPTKGKVWQPPKQMA